MLHSIRFEYEEDSTHFFNAFGNNIITGVCKINCLTFEERQFAVNLAFVPFLIVFRVYLT